MVYGGGMLSRLVRYNLSGYRDRNEVMRATGGKCWCGGCLCCRVRKYLLRVERMNYHKSLRNSD